MWRPHQPPLHHRKTRGYEYERGRYDTGLDRSYGQNKSRSSSKHRQRSLYRRPSRDSGSDSGRDYGEDHLTNYTLKRRWTFREYDTQLNDDLKYLAKRIGRVLVAVTGLTLVAYMLSISCQIPILGWAAHACGRCAVETVEQQHINQALNALFIDHNNTLDASKYYNIPHWGNPYDNTREILRNVKSDVLQSEVKHYLEIATNIKAVADTMKPFPGQSCQNFRNTDWHYEKRTVVEKFFKEIKAATEDLSLLFNITDPLQNKLRDLQRELAQLELNMPDLDTWISKFTKNKRNRKQLDESFRAVQTHYKEDWGDLKTAISAAQEAQKILTWLADLYDQGTFQIDRGTIDHLISRFQNHYSLTKDDKPKSSSLSTATFTTSRVRVWVITDRPKRKGS
ncbi:hypothetical protein DM02DRAFT_677580 [Periconia macrospinosa]|uniref:Uncharacterized protein n=1 Tax=Periconia macrospinosa TaxID=97972 RepID=A0A2V1D2S1_9PLEO|nr:hypothetical protein DM02DRAFT_677580 [Periconia macrospinosa]